MDHHFSEQEVEDYQGTFTLFDRNKSGTIRMVDLGTVIRAHTFLTEERLSAIKAKQGQAEEIDFKNFLDIMADVKEEMLSEEDMLKAIQKFDTDNTGRIHLSVLRKILSLIPEPFTEEEIQEFVKLADKDKGRTIDNKELTKMIMAELYPAAIVPSEAAFSSARISRQRDK